LDCSGGTKIEKRTGEGARTFVIEKKTPIIEILRRWPEARRVFASHGMACVGCMGASTETVESGAKMHGIDVDRLLRELNAACGK